MQRKKKVDSEQKREFVDPFSIPLEKIDWAAFTRQRKEDERLAEEKRKQEKYGPKGTCKVCKIGAIHAKYVSEYDAMSGPIRCGGPSQFREHLETYYCKGCGLKYEFVPGNVETIESDDDE